MYSMVFRHFCFLSSFLFCMYCNVFGVCICDLIRKVARVNCSPFCSHFNLLSKRYVFVFANTVFFYHHKSRMNHAFFFSSCGKFVIHAMCVWGWNNFALWIERFVFFMKKKSVPNHKIFIKQTILIQRYVLLLWQFVSAILISYLQP